MTHELTFLERLRVRIAIALHTILVKRGYYSETTTGENAYACTIATDYADLEEDLHSLEFIRNIASSVKYRTTPRSDRDIGVASWAYFPGSPVKSEYMLHLDLFIGPERDQTDVYAHWEPSWITNPRRHYWANEVDTTRGVRMTRELFTDAGIEYTTLPLEERYAPETVGDDDSGLLDGS